MLPCKVSRLVAPNQFVQLLTSGMRQDVREHRIQMETNKTPEIIERKRLGNVL